MTERFDDEELRAAYQAAGAAVGSGSRAQEGAQRAACPEPDALLAAVRGEGAEAERLRVLDHALQCDACRREFALLHAVSPPPRRRSAVFDSLLGGRFASGRPWARVASLALAASVVIAVGLFGTQRWRQRAGDGGANVEVMRGVNGGPALVAPADAATLAADSIAFAWRPVAGAFSYTLEVDAADGTVLFTAPTADTILVAPLGSSAPGEYRWVVRARLDDGSELRSESRPLRLR